jgi:hypothetical protein
MRNFISGKGRNLYLVLRRGILDKRALCIKTGLGVKLVEFEDSLPVGICRYDSLRTYEEMPAGMRFDIA